MVEILKECARLEEAGFSPPNDYDSSNQEDRQKDREPHYAILIPIKITSCFHTELPLLVWTVYCNLTINNFRLVRYSIVK